MLSEFKAFIAKGNVLDLVNQVGGENALSKVSSLLGQRQQSARGLSGIFGE